MVAITLHVRGKKPVSELASALTDLDLVDAVVAANQQDADEPGPAGSSTETY